MLDLWLRGCGFDCWSGCYQVVTTRMVDCLWTGKPIVYITNTKVNSAVHPFLVGKSSTSPGYVEAGHIHPCRVADNTVWSHLAGDTSQFCDGFFLKSYMQFLTFFFTFLVMLCYSQWVLGWCGVDNGWAESSSKQPTNHSSDVRPIWLRFHNFWLCHCRGT